MPTRAWGDRPAVMRPRSGVPLLNWTVGPTLTKKEKVMTPEQGKLLCNVFTDTMKFENEVTNKVIQRHS